MMCTSIKVFRVLGFHVRSSIVLSNMTPIGVQPAGRRRRLSAQADRSLLQYSRLARPVAYLSHFSGG